jgi:hypothetical protein
MLERSRAPAKPIYGFAVPCPFGSPSMLRVPMSLQVHRCVSAAYLRKAASASVNRRRPRRASRFDTEQRFRRTQRRFTVRNQQTLRGLVSLEHIQRRQGLLTMNRLIWLVGAVVIVLFVLAFFGLR